jgi:hypothetical protein
VDARHGHDLIQELAFRGRGGLPVALRWTAAYSPRLARVTGPSLGGLVTVTSELQSGLW